MNDPTETFSKHTNYVQTGQDLASILTVRMVRVQSNLNRQAARILGKYGLTILQWRILYLLKLEGSMAATQIHELMDTDKGQLSRRLKAMEKDGYIRQATGDSPTRRRALELTELGEQKFEQAIPDMTKRYEHIVSRFDESEQALLMDFIMRLDEASEIDPT